jgi:hypothetical protein
MPAYISFMSSIPAEQNSKTQNILFQSTSCTSPNFLKFDVTSSPLAESGGVNIAGITDDYIGAIRQGNPGYTGSGTSPDIGAWNLILLPDVLVVLLQVRHKHLMQHHAMVQVSRSI